MTNEQEADAMTNEQLAALADEDLRNALTARDAPAEMVAVMVERRDDDAVRMSILERLSQPPTAAIDGLETFEESVRATRRAAGDQP